MKIKFCGLRTKEGWGFCERCAVDYVGINFVPSSKRCVTEDQWEEYQIFRGKFGGKVVGVISGQLDESTLSSLKKWDLDGLQWHGSQITKADLERLRSFFSGFLWIGWSTKKEGEPPWKLLKEYQAKLLLDGPRPGSGEPAKMEWLESTAKKAEVYGVAYGVAGGISAENLATYVQAFPTADWFDLASGLEVGGQFSVEQAGRVWDAWQLVKSPCQ